MDKLFELVVGSAAIDQTLEFRALSVSIDNPTNQWVRLDGIGAFIPQYTIGATYPLPGTTRARFSFTAPSGQVQPPTIAGQGIAVTFYELAMPSTAGVGMLGGRAPYYDRNPTSKVFTTQSLFNTNVIQIFSDGAVPLVGMAYTVPTGRRAYLENLVVYVEITVAYTAGVQGWVSSAIRVQPSGGNATEALSADLFTATAIGSNASAALGASIELQPGEAVSGFAFQARSTAVVGSAVHKVSFKVTEFDA